MGNGCRDSARQHCWLPRHSRPSARFKRPRTGGYELAARLREHFPQMHVLFTSGYTEESAVRRGLMELGNAFLEKPYTVAALSNAVQEALAKKYRRSASEGIG